jgi:RIO kinase 1
VEHDHPHALEFLRKDLTNITDFFRKKGVNVLGLRDLFDFVVDATIKDGEQEAVLERLNERAEERKAALGDKADEIDVEEEVFKQIYIPRTLDEVRYLRHADVENIVCSFETVPVI